MNSSYPETSLGADGIGTEMYGLVRELYPICRSITGRGFRDTLRIIQKQIPLTVREVASGTKVFDWTVPKEWNINDAYVKDPKGKKIIDFHDSNLHVVSYSVPIKERLSLDELKKHLFTLPDHPDWIPYRTSYYNENWGFCLSHRKYESLEEGEYEVFIDSSLEDGHLTYGECYIEGAISDEVLITTHTCHPSLCNDNLSGVALATFLAKQLTDHASRYSYRFLFVPGAIGSITWLCLNEQRASRIKHGLVLACVGDAGKFTYKKSRRGDAGIDRAVIHILQHSGKEYEVTEFSPYGYDERQFCSPGFNLPVGCFMRTPHGRFPEYHTSADNLDFIAPQYLAESFSRCMAVFQLIDGNRKYLNQNPKCEPQLGKRGLYAAIGGEANAKAQELAMLWVLNLSDGDHTLLDIAERSGLEFSFVKTAADKLLEHDLLKEAS